MSDTEPAVPVGRQVADLRLQVDALQKDARRASLPSVVREIRSTVRWSSIAIAAALVVSSMIKACGDGRVHDLERRVEALEAARPSAGLAPP